MSAAHGVDLLQHIARLHKSALAVDEPVECAQGGPGLLPAAVLPVFKGEPPLYGQSASESRCGIGLKWPPSAQAPCAGESERGVGRIPLLAAWERLGDDDWDSTGGRRRDQFLWRPGGERDRRGPGLEPAEMLVGKGYVNR